MYGDFDHVSFDGKAVAYPGDCEYNLASIKHQYTQDVNFYITSHVRTAGERYTKLSIYNHIVMLEPNGIVKVHEKAY